MDFRFKAVQNDGGLMAEGDYEVYVKSAEQTTTKSGNECIKFDFVVRSDVEQAYKGKHIFKNFYPNRETGMYDENKIGRYANALGIEVGQPFDLEDLIGKNCIVHISHFTGEDNVTRECIFYTAKSKVEPYISDSVASSFSESLSDADDEELPL